MSEETLFLPERFGVTEESSSSLLVTADESGEGVEIRVYAINRQLSGTFPPILRAIDDIVRRGLNVERLAAEFPRERWPLHRIKVLDGFFGPLKVLRYGHHTERGLFLVLRGKPRGKP